MSDQANEQRAHHLAGWITNDAPDFATIKHDLLIALNAAEQRVWTKIITEMENAHNPKLDGWIKWCYEQSERSVMGEEGA